MALTHFPEPLRPAVEAIFRIDATLAEVVAGTTEPQVGLIRLAWWREALERLDSDEPPAEPRLEAVANHCLPRGVSGAALSEIEDGYAALLDGSGPDRIEKAGATLFFSIAQLIGDTDTQLAEAGALAMLARVRGLAETDVRDSALKNMAKLGGHRFAKPLRPLTLLARLAARDFLRTSPEPEATPGRAFAMLSHRLSGIVTRAN
ncbi:squalene/phytoene synthase family protein [Sphingomicrobium clamense]|uniref:squalene/phytoene synthase family protein n=1 Tax=Sphingomicrobium clamense TaxID=2851013 RepID=UPI002104F57F|nr:squalene/phytoene synthase family protein [Sphingomicrobium sp. B8]